MKKSILFLLLAVVSVVLHNLVYAVFGFEEPVFFILTFVLLFMSVLSLFRRKGLKGLWRKKAKKKLLILLILLFLWLFVRFVIGGPEDTWICVDGEWTRHGVPSAPTPTVVCE